MPYLHSQVPVFLSFAGLIYTMHDTRFPYGFAQAYVRGVGVYFVSKALVRASWQLTIGSLSGQAKRRAQELPSKHRAVADMKCTSSIHSSKLCACTLVSFLCMGTKDDALSSRIYFPSIIRCVAVRLNFFACVLQRARITWLYSGDLAGSALFLIISVFRASICG